jgi:stringent starvation protein B
MTDLSTKPYLIRAIYEWCADAGFTPYLSVKVDANTRVPMEYVKGGEIVLSISQLATRDLTIGNDVVQFSARFNGVSREVSVPIYAVQGVFARENGRGVFFDPETPPEIEDADTSAPAGTTQIASRAPANRTPTLQAVPQTAALVDQPTDGDASQSVKTTDPESPDSPDKPGKPKGPPRGNLRIIK